MNHSFDVEHAIRYGLEEAVFIHHFLFWITKNDANRKHLHKGRVWTYNSVNAFQEIFPYLTIKQIRRVLDSLEDQKVIISGNYNKSACDRTKWYAFVAPLDEWRGCPNGKKDLPKRANVNAQEGEPIPYVLPNKRTVTARQNGETVAVGNFGINGEHQIDEGSPSFKLVKRYHKFSTAKKFHIRSIHPITRKTTYALGAGVGGWTRRTLQNWQACCEALLEQHQYKKVKRVMLWYFEHCEDEWLPAMCRTMPTFCERFDGIEKAWRRKNKNQETEDDSPAPRITYE